MDPQLRSALPLLALWRCSRARRRRTPSSRPSGVITLRDAVAAALRNNPDLAAAALEVRASDAPSRAGAAAAQSDADRRGGESRRLGRVTKAPSRRRRRCASRSSSSSAASAPSASGWRRSSATAAQWDYEVRRATLLADTAQRVRGGAGAAGAAGACRRHRRLAERVPAAASTRRCAPAPRRRPRRARARVAFGEAQLALAERERELAAARVALAAAWGSAAADLRARRRRPGRDHAAARRGRWPRSSANPDLARWTTELAAREAALSLEQARAVPDVTDRARDRATSSTATRSPPSSSSACRCRSSIATRAPSRPRPPTSPPPASASAPPRWRCAPPSAAPPRVCAPRTSAPRACATSSSRPPRRRSTGAREAYRRGALRYLEVLDAQRTWFELRDQYFDALAAYHVARIDLDRLDRG